jgi:beta-glucuronidase
LHDPLKNIWSAAASGLKTRELYVNGARAQLSRGPSQSGPLGHPHVHRTGGTGQQHGVLARRRQDRGDQPERLGAQFLPDHRRVGTRHHLAQPCYRNTQVPYNFKSGAVIGQNPFNVSWVQNAYELLNTPGHFYLDSSHSTIYYVPRPGEDLATADVEAPVLQTLVQGSGTAASPLSDISFSGLTFAYTTWLDPALPTGYAEGQAGWHITGDNLTEVTMADLTKTPGGFGWTTTAISSSTAARSPTSAWSDSNSSRAARTPQSSAIGSLTSGATRCRSAASIPLIGIHRWGDQVSGNTLRDNVITFAGQVYRSAVGVFLGYTTGTTVTHNAIGQLPYTAISVNLGWEGTTYSGATITYNEICQDMGVLDDGGVLYAQLPMTSPSVMKYNYLHDEKTTGGAPLYLDSTAGNWTAQYNVLQTGESTSRNIQNCCGVAAQHNTVQYNYSNASGAVHGTPDPTNTVTDNYDNLSVFPRPRPRRSWRRQASSRGTPICSASAATTTPQARSATRATAGTTPAGGHRAT